MKKVYIIAGIAALAIVIAAYWSGGRVGAEKCKSEIADISAQAAIQTQNEITTTKREINAETYNTGVRDIRNRLRAKYTIAD
ncbi:MAG: hypothetical protein LBJ18_02855 [Rickettsiales bacterium]|jgi:hypothetical protein|nr:hypothetical protein [Rickettsiales bacterium]